MNRRYFFVSASKYSVGLAMAGAGGLLASESKPHGGADKGHEAKPADKGHGAKPAADKGHGDKGGHGEKPAAAAKPAEAAHVPEATKPAAHPAPAKTAAPKPAAKPKPARAAATRPAQPAQAVSEKPLELRPHTAEEVLTELKAGNKRFVSGKPRHPNISNLRVRQTGREGEHPFAVLLTCSDSRVPPELVFDQGLGDIYTVRMAGNVANADQIASIEYAVDQSRAPLVVVMGHTECNTIRSMVEGRVSQAMSRVLGNVKQAFDRTRYGAPSLTGKPLLTAVTQMNVWESIEDMLRGSAVLRDKLRTSEVRIVGANYQVETGEVSWMGAHPDQCDFV